MHNYVGYLLLSGLNLYKVQRRVNPSPGISYSQSLLTSPSIISLQNEEKLISFHKTISMKFVKKSLFTFIVLNFVERLQKSLSL